MTNNPFNVDVMELDDHEMDLDLESPKDEPPGNEPSVLEDDDCDSLFGDTPKDVQPNLTATALHNETAVVPGRPPTDPHRFQEAFPSPQGLIPGPRLLPPTLARPFPTRIYLPSAPRPTSKPGAATNGSDRNKRIESMISDLENNVDSDEDFSDIFDDTAGRYRRTVHKLRELQSSGSTNEAKEQKLLAKMHELMKQLGYNTPEQVRLDDDAIPVGFSSKFDVATFVDVFSFAARRFESKPPNLTLAGMAEIQSRIDYALSETIFKSLTVEEKCNVTKCMSAMNMGMEYYFASRELYDGTFEVPWLAGEDILRDKFGFKEISHWVNATYFGAPWKGVYNIPNPPSDRIEAPWATFYDSELEAPEWQLHFNLSRHRELRAGFPSPRKISGAVDNLAQGKAANMTRPSTTPSSRNCSTGNPSSFHAARQPRMSGPSAVNEPSRAHKARDPDNSYKNAYIPAFPTPRLPDRSGILTPYHFAEPEDVLSKPCPQKNRAEPRLPPVADEKESSDIRFSDLNYSYLTYSDGSRRKGLITQEEAFQQAQAEQERHRRHKAAMSSRRKFPGWQRGPDLYRPDATDW